MSRQIYLLGIGVTLVAGAFLLTDHLLYPPADIPLREARRVRPDMTLRQVEAIFGRPADAFGKEHYSWGDWPLFKGNIIHHRRWRGKMGTACLRFDSDEKVKTLKYYRAGEEHSILSWVGVYDDEELEEPVPSTLVELTNSRRSAPSPLTRLLARLGW